MNSGGQRQRSKCVINTDKKNVRNSSYKNTNIPNVEESKITTNIRKRDSNATITDINIMKKQRESLKNTEINFNFEKPKFTGIKKEYYTNNSYVMIGYFKKEYFFT